MKKEWTTPALDEVFISDTANGQNPDHDYDGSWVEVTPGHFFRPGSGEGSIGNGNN